MERLPNEIQQRIWKTYFRTFVLPEIESRKEWKLRTMLEVLRNPRHSKWGRDSLLDMWIDFVACRCKSLPDVYAQLSAHFDTCYAKTFPDGTFKLVWLYDAMHTFSITDEGTGAIQIAYHGPRSYEMATVDANASIQNRAFVRTFVDEGPTMHQIQRIRRPSRLSSMVRGA